MLKFIKKEKARKLQIIVFVNIVQKPISTVPYPLRWLLQKQNTDDNKC